MSLVIIIVDYSSMFKFKGINDTKEAICGVPTVLCVVNYKE